MSDKIPVANAVSAVAVYSDDTSDDKLTILTNYIKKLETKIDNLESILMMNRCSTCKTKRELYRCNDGLVYCASCIKTQFGNNLFCNMFCTHFNPNGFQICSCGEHYICNKCDDIHCKNTKTASAWWPGRK